VLDVITWIFKIFKALLEEDVDQLWAWIGDATKAFWEAFKSDVDNDLTYIKNLFLDAWNYVWYDVLMPYYDWLYETFKPIFDTISEAFTVAVTGIKTLFSTDWEEIKGYMLVVFDWINENLLGIFDKVNTAFKTALDLINSKIKTVWDDIKGFIKPVHDYINDTVMGVFDKVKTALEKAWGAMPTFVKTTWDNILEFIKGGINTVIEAVNSFIRRINGIKISIPSVDIPGVGKVGGGEIAFKLPELQKLARGGIVSSPTIAQIGEKGAEAVVPLQNTSFLDALAGSIGNAVLGAMQFSQGMGGQTTQGNGNIILQVDGVQLARVLMPAMTKETNRIGNVIIQGV
jgi:phage-related protein